MIVSSEPSSNFNNSLTSHDGHNQLTSDDADDYIYKYLGPTHITLSLFILLQNSVILADNYKDRKKFVTAMFMLIALADILTALSEFARSGNILLCVKSQNAHVSYDFAIVNLSGGFYSYICSIFYTTILTIVKTINIVDPFRRLRRTAINISILVTTLFWLGVWIADVIFFFYTLDHHHTKSCQQVWALFLRYDFLGEGVICDLFGVNCDGAYDDDSEGMVKLLLVILEVFVPCTIVLVCMLLQMVHIKRSLQRPAQDHPQLASANYVNATVLMISLLFFLCNIPFVLNVLLTALGVYPDEGPAFPGVVYKYTLPLVNAALFPLIIILRKRTLAQRYKAVLLQVLVMPCVVFRRAWAWLWDSRQLVVNGYQSID